MMLSTKDRVERIDELEELWAAPTAPEPPLAERSVPWRRALPHVSGRLLALGWIAFFVGVFAFEPAPAEGTTNPLLGDVVVAGMALALLAAASLGTLLPRFGFAAAGIAGALGMVIAIACQTTGHHAGSWWLAELGATALLTGLAGTGLAGRLRRE
jgi:hypothetical protein